MPASRPEGNTPMSSLSTTSSSSMPAGCSMRAASTTAAAASTSTAPAIAPTPADAGAATASAGGPVADATAGVDALGPLVTQLSALVEALQGLVAQLGGAATQPAARGAVTSEPALGANAAPQERAATDAAVLTAASIPASDPPARASRTRAKSRSTSSATPTTSTPPPRAGRRAATTGATAVTGSTVARATGAYMTQYGSDTNRGAPSSTVDCGPVSALMALRFAGLDAPGASGAKSYDAVKAMRKLVTGSTQMRTTSMDELRAGVQKAGAKTRHLDTTADILAAAKRGEGVILGGKAFESWNERVGRGAVPASMGHFVMLAGFDEASGMILVNDPQSRTGPVPMPLKMIEQFHRGSQSAWTVTQ